MLKQINESFDKLYSNSIKESKSNMTRILKKFNDAYKWMYDNNFDTYDLMMMGEELMKDHSDLLQEFVDFRGDMLTSDREVAAFACALGYAGQVVDIDEYLQPLRDKYNEAYKKGLITAQEAKNAPYRKAYEMIKALNMD